jgi:PAS domain S-box-containing protein
MPEPDANVSSSFFSAPETAPALPTDWEQPYLALRESEERLRLAISAADIGTWYWDIRTQVLEWSHQAKALFGLPPDFPMTYDNFLNCLHPEDRDWVHQAVERTLQERADYDVEFRAIWPDKSQHWLAARGRAYGENPGHRDRMKGVVQNIDARKAAEAALEAVLEREHRIAETLQRSLLLMPAEDAFPGLSVTSLYEAALDDMEVGGDFLDAFALTGDCVAFVVGDVSGKGLDAAARTAEVKFVLRAFLRENPVPEIAMARVNTHLCYPQIWGITENVGFLNEAAGWELPFEGFVCLALVIINTQTGELHAASAGAELPQILKPSGEAVEIPVFGTPLAVTPNAEYHGFHTILEDGDLLMMTTDGLTEARRGGEFFGPEGLVQSVRQTENQTSLRQIAQNVFDQARHFTGTKLRDDACLLLARRR